MKLKFWFARFGPVEIAFRCLNGFSSGDAETGAFGSWEAPGMIFFLIGFAWMMKWDCSLSFNFNWSGLGVSIRMKRYHMFQQGMFIVRSKMISFYREIVIMYITIFRLPLVWSLSQLCKHGVSVGIINWTKFTMRKTRVNLDLSCEPSSYLFLGMKNGPITLWSRRRD